MAGMHFSQDLVICRNEMPQMSAEIYICPPDQAKPRPKYQNLYVNLRRINNGTVSNAIRESFSRFISAYGNKPSWFCFLDVEPSKIDVNVHPTKQQVKFDDERALFSFIYRTVFAQLEACASYSPLVQKFQEIPKTEEPTAQCQRPAVGTPYRLLENPDIDKRPQQIQLPLTTMTLVEEKKIDIADTPWDSIPCFQVHNKYIAVSVSDGLLLIDQHAAHERVLYEKILDATQIGIDAQTLIFPITMELKPFEKETALSVREHFSKAGFEIKDFGGNTVAVYSMPSDFSSEGKVKEAIEEMIAQFLSESNTAILSSVHRHFAAAYACGAAVKFGYELKSKEMNSLLTALFSTKNPHICPHGRPTFSKISLSEINKRFLR